MICLVLWLVGPYICRNNIRYSEGFFKDTVCVNTCLVTAVLPLSGQHCGTVCLTASATGHHLQTIQTILENIYVLLFGPQHPVSEH